MSWKGNNIRLRAFLFVLVCVIGAVLLWARYFNIEAQEARHREKSYAQAVEGLKKYEEILTNDIIGGKTPEETLSLFRTSLEEKNIEYATRFFVFTNEQKRKEMNEILYALDEEKLKLLTKSILRAEPYLQDRLHSNDYKFVTYNNSRTAFELYIDMEYNPYSHIWKIESL